MRVLRHFFPRLPEWLNNMADPRNRSYITYEQSVLVLMCIMKNVSGIVTMRNMNAAFNEDAAIANLAYISGETELKEMPDWQTANNYLCRLGVEELERIRRSMIQVLIRGKQFNRYKLFGTWPIILDGTGIAYFKERHCEHDLVTRIKDPTTGKETILYYHKLLEAKIILSPDLVISIDTEFIENENEDVPKQDCEQRAAERLLKRLKENYPRLPVCILGDGLYATMPFMELCSGNRWKYILNLKDGRQQTLAEDFRTFVDTKDFRHRVKDLCGSECGTGAFRNNMQEISGKNQVCNMFEYRHAVREKAETREVRFVWVTNFIISAENVERLIKAGRQRWKIENEGFNNQKNGIYKIEHLCSRNPNAMKNHYLITQISDILMQLYLAFGKLLEEVNRSIKCIARCIGEYFWRCPLTHEDITEIEKKTALRIAI